MRILILLSMFVSMTAGAVSGGASGGGGVGPRPHIMMMSFNPRTDMMASDSTDIFWYHSLRSKGELVQLPPAFAPKGQFAEYMMPSLSPYVMARVELVKSKAVFHDGSVAFVHKAMGSAEGTEVYLEATKAQEMSEVHEAAVYMSAETGSWIVINREEGSF